jgi:glutamate 5-kinase
VAEHTNERGPVGIVSSGTIALGINAARLTNGRRRSIPRLQAASMLGQTRLQSTWADALARHDVPTAQVLLTGVELVRSPSKEHAENGLRALFELGAVPVLNENDASAVDEISFGDNDVLAAQISVLTRARLLVRLTGSDGVLSHPPGDKRAEVVADGWQLRTVSSGRRSRIGLQTSGPILHAAELAAAGGVDVAISSLPSLLSLLRGEKAGTYFEAKPTGESPFELWLRYGKRPVSRLEVNAVTMRAMADTQIGIHATDVLSRSGDFRVGDGLEICLASRKLIARGVSSIDSSKLDDDPQAEVVRQRHLVML